MKWLQVEKLILCQPTFYNGIKLGDEFLNR